MCISVSANACAVEWKKLFTDIDPHYCYFWPTLKLKSHATHSLTVWENSKSVFSFFQSFSFQPCICICVCVYEWESKKFQHKDTHIHLNGTNFSYIGIKEGSFSNLLHKHSVQAKMWELIQKSAAGFLSCKFSSSFFIF